MKVHQSVMGFDLAAEEYQRGRPEFPEEAMALLAAQLRLEQNCIAVDVGAGTGKLTRALLKTGTKVIALEPVEGMRKKFSVLLPSTWAIGGVAEHIPLKSGIADSAVAGNAFHWFANLVALAEIKRVLKPRGRLGLIWTWVDESVGWVAELSRMVEQHGGDTPLHTDGTWKYALDHFDGFKTVTHQCFRFVHTGDFELIRDHVISVSFIAKMVDRDRQRVVSQARNLIETHPSTAGRAHIELPYRMDMYIYEARE